MLTGDQRLTAEAVGRELGVLGPGDCSMDGRELDALTGLDRDQAIGRTHAFSRVTPEHKLVIVRSLSRERDRRHAGRRISDTAALQRRTWASRWASAAPTWRRRPLRSCSGRSLRLWRRRSRKAHHLRNIRKFVFYLFSCNLAEVLVFLGAAVAGWAAPLLPLQILWLNLVTDTFPALALALEPGEPDVMRRPPEDEKPSSRAAFWASPLAYHHALDARTFLGRSVTRRMRATVASRRSRWRSRPSGARSRGWRPAARACACQSYALAGAGAALLQRRRWSVLARILRSPLDQSSGWSSWGSR
jgi:hypothetical protein